mmetsp:Transcript_1611/g.2211  ORF Transcript_1611/g.2211 Transcript_1611/m.2211 type:complete len:203 (-) Transcript_1611:103-711(-)
MNQLFATNFVSQAFLTSFISFETSAQHFGQFCAKQSTDRSGTSHSNGIWHDTNTQDGGTNATSTINNKPHERPPFSFKECSHIQLYRYVSQQMKDASMQKHGTWENSPPFSVTNNLFRVLGTPIFQRFGIGTYHGIDIEWSKSTTINHETQNNDLQNRKQHRKIPPSLSYGIDVAVGERFQVGVVLFRMMIPCIMMVSSIRD